MPPGAKGGRSINVMEQYQDSPEYNRQYEVDQSVDTRKSARLLSLYILTVQ